jgi:tRNA (guanine37-N1)-methyltransferase
VRGRTRKLQIDILTLFPEMFQGVFDSGVIGRAMEQGLVGIGLHNFREHSHDKHHTVDDYPYGGGAGMVLKPEPIFEAVEAIKGDPEIPVILLNPAGRLFTQQVAEEFAGYSRMIIICGRYEGVDQRVGEQLATDEISIGDYVLTGGEIAAMVVVDAVVRLLPGVLGSELSPMEDSHVAGLLEYPQYTRPPSYRGWPVPEVLLSGNHAQIAGWRREQSIRRTNERRPELLAKVKLNPAEKRLVEKLR